MGYNLKALHYCGTHTNTFLVKNCKNCGQGMCAVCLDKHPAFCPECRIEIGIKNGSKNKNREVLLMTISGIIVFGLYVGYSYIEYGDALFDYPNRLYLLLSFAVGVSLIGTYFVLRDLDFYSEVIEIPIIGLKAALFIPLITFASTIPVFYYLYQTLSLLWGKAFKKERL